MSDENSSLWYDAILNELESMAKNQVWDVVELSEGAKAIGCKWVYKTKRDSTRNIEHSKARLIAKGFS